MPVAQLLALGHEHEDQPPAINPLETLLLKHHSSSSIERMQLHTSSDNPIIAACNKAKQAFMQKVLYV